ncbi:MAG: hypothetical protein R2834_19200 [Rhodothermales bacterium]
MNPSTADAHDHDGGPTEVESEGINSGFIFSIMLGTIVIVIILATIGFTTARVKSMEIRDVATAAIQYPELRDTRASAATRLNHYAVVDAANGIYQVPIEQAMKAMAAETFQQGAQGDYSNALRLAQPNP